MLKLRTFLTWPSLLLLLFAVTTVSFIYRYYDEISIRDLVDHLMEATERNVQQQIDRYLEPAAYFSMVNARRYSGKPLEFTTEQQHTFFDEISTLPYVSWISLGRERDGGYLGIVRNRR